MTPKNDFIITQEPSSKSTPELTNPPQPLKVESIETPVKIETQEVLIKPLSSDGFPIIDNTKFGWFDFWSLAVPVGATIISVILTALFTTQQKNKEMKEQKDRYEKEIEKQEDRSKVLYALKLIEEWESEAMRQCRGDAYEKFVKNYKNYPKYFNGTEIKPIIDIYYENQEQNYSEEQTFDMMMIFRIDKFLRRVYLLGNNNLIDRKIICSFLSEDYKSWKNRYFQIQRQKLDEIESNPAHFNHNNYKIDGWSDSFRDYEWILGEELKDKENN